MAVAFTNVDRDKTLRRYISGNNEQISDHS